MKKLLRKKISWGVAVSNITWLTALIIVLASAMDVWLAPRQTHFELAQRNTVLVETATGTGSGVILRRSNSRGKRVFVLTNAHVVRGTDKVTLHQAFHSHGQKLGEQVFQGEVITHSTLNDLALIWLHAPAELFPGVRMDDLEPLPVGAPVYHVGNFHRVFDGSFVTGVISQSGVQERASWPWAGIDIDQTTAVIIPGSSGGPVFNADNHRLAGLACGWAQQSGISFFIPVRQVSVWARGSGLEWVMAGDACPNDVLLQTMAEMERAATIKVSTPEPTIIRILLGPEHEPDEEQESENDPRH